MKREMQAIPSGTRTQANAVQSKVPIWAYFLLDTVEEIAALEAANERAAGVEVAVGFGVANEEAPLESREALCDGTATVVVCTAQVTAPSGLRMWW